MLHYNNHLKEKCWFLYQNSFQFLRSTSFFPQKNVMIHNFIQNKLFHIFIIEVQFSTQFFFIIFKFNFCDSPAILISSVARKNVRGVFKFFYYYSMKNYHSFRVILLYCVAPFLSYALTLMFTRCDTLFTLVQYMLTSTKSAKKA